jgi:arylsulfatase A-like enzyme
MLTGKLPHAVGVTLLRTALPENQVTLAEHLKTHGFQTGAIGKMHFNSAARHGFDTRVDLPDYRRRLESEPPQPPPADAKTKPPWRPFQDPARVWLNAERLPTGYYDDDSDGTYFAQEAVRFLRAHREERFCLWLGFYQPHAPFDFPIEYAGRYSPQDMPVRQAGPEDERWIPTVFRDLSEEEKRGIAASYYTAVEYLDKNVGLVLHELAVLGLDRETLVIYVGDNGYLLGDHGRFEKHTMWEPAVRVPLLVRDPRNRPGTKVAALVECVDLAPTILESLEVAPMQGLHGRSLNPLLTGRKRRHRRYVFSEFLPDNMAMIRSEEWKYVFTTGRKDLAMGYATGRPPAGVTHRLYDLRNDPGETHNLAYARQHARTLRELQRVMIERFRATDPRAGRLPPGLAVEETLAWFCETPEGTEP